MNKENVENAKSTSVFDLTKDLMEAEQEDKISKPGVDWGWGSDHSSSPRKAASNTEEGEDSDATVEMDSDDDHEDANHASEGSKASENATEQAGEKELPSADCPSMDYKNQESDDEDDAADGKDHSTTPHSPAKLPKGDDEKEGEQVETKSLKSSVKPSEDTGESEGDDDMDDPAPADSSAESKEASLSPTRRSSRCLASEIHIEEDQKEENSNVNDESDKTVDFPVRQGDNDEGSDADDNAEAPETRPVASPEKASEISAANDVEDQPQEPPTVEQPEEDNLFRSTDKLFVAADKDSVTVADICRSIATEYHCQLNKTSKKLVRMRLIDLMRKKVVPQADDDDEEEDQVSEQGDAEESEQSDFEQADGSDMDYEEAKKRPKKTTAKKSKANKEPKKSRPKKPNARKAAKAARMVEAERLRKKRMEELRIRNEEMQLNQSKEEQERAEAIAAKFETNTDELRLKRIEDRLTLLELLDKKRIAIIDALETKIEEKEASKAEECAEMSTEQVASVEQSDEDSESSSDEEELDVVGAVKPFKPLKPIHTHLPSKALNFLKDFRSPEKKRNRSALPSSAATIASSSNFLKSITSPTKKNSARSNLRQALKQKVRKQGNLWLARELGYKTEEDHLKDCQTAADQKLALVRKLEKARIEANERKLLRERMLQQDEIIRSSDQEEEEGGNSPSRSEEEDEEMQMAKEMENAVAAGESDEVINDEIVGNAKKCNSVGSVVGNSDSTKQIDGGELDAIANESEKSTEDKDVIEPHVDAQPAPPISVAASPSNDKRDSEESAQAANGPSPTNDVDSNDFDAEDDDGEVEFKEHQETAQDSNRPRNAAWQAMLRKEAEMAKKQKKKRRQGLVEDQAEEEEEEEVAGLEDFGFTVKKKKQGDDDDDENEEDDDFDEDDLKHVVDDVSDNEGDEEAGEAARKRQERLEEKEKHKEIIRRMREGYDGRRGGITGSGVGARGMHRFDQLVAADNREDAKRLGLLNDDELDSEDEGEGKKEKTADDNEDDEAALLDKMLKDRFLHRTDVNLEENFSADEEEVVVEGQAANDSDAEEERVQEKLARRFAKSARMQRLEEEYAGSQEFSQQRLIDEDKSMKEELDKMKNGLLRQRSISSSTRTSSISSQDSRLSGQKRSIVPPSRIFAEKSGTSLTVALRASGKIQRRTSFLGGENAGKAKDNGALIHKSVSLGHVVFASANRSNARLSTGDKGEKRKRSGPAAGSLFKKLARHAQ